MAKCVDIKKAWDFGVLCDWFINSIDETEPPCWTPEHIEELLDGFYVIPKRKEIAAPVFDAEPVMQWISVKDRVPELPPIRYYVSRMVLTYRSGDKRVTVMFYERTVVRGKAVERWKTYWDRIGDAPDFWMPLPEPPEEE